MDHVLHCVLSIYLALPDRRKVSAQKHLLSHVKLSKIEATKNLKKYLNFLAEILYKNPNFLFSFFV